MNQRHIYFTHFIILSIISAQPTVVVQLGSDIDGEAALDYSGNVSLNSDGTIVAIGAHGNDDNGSDAGHVRVFSIDGIVPYTGPVWHVAGYGSDSLGNGS